MSAGHYFRLAQWSGWESWRNWQSYRKQARACARKLLRNLWKEDPAKVDMIIETPGATYQVIDRTGRVAITFARNPHNGKPVEG